jgi:hypothetical protein
MKLVLLMAVSGALVAAAGYYGMAPQIAEGFRLLTLVFGALVILGSIAGGIRVSGRRRAPNLAPRVRRHAA